MSIKYHNILDTVDDDGVQVPSFYGKYLVENIDEARERARELGFLGAVRVDGVEKADMFVTEEEFEDVIVGKSFPLAIVPVV